MQDAIKTIQELYESFKNLDRIEVNDDHFEIVIIVDDGLTEEKIFMANETVEALQWLEEKHGIKSE